MSNPPTIVFVPGAWHPPTCYDKLTKLLEEQHKLKCICITLPSTTGNPDATFKDDLDAAQDAISSETTEGRNVVVVAHSYGGMVGNSAIKGFAKPPPGGSDTASQTSRPETGFVIGLILIASGFTLTGLTFMDPFFDRPPPAWRVNKATGYAELVVSPRQFFYHDVPAEEAEFRVSQLRSQSLRALFEGREYTYAGWKDVPAWYIGTIEDQGLPVWVQRMGVGIAREMGARVQHRELQTSHSPFLSQPKATVRIMLEAIDAFTGKEPGSEPTLGLGSEVVTVPKAVLWRPFSWFKYGIPLAFGHVVGRMILLFRWGKR
ncbi:hypothetical protein FE257_008502 [Aspergillus nanangensis]|uniref:AB hydrolase-1 domain-containing protein n=1 Tax=Aspergillus nanangensis TaxID=2582783 RepID=A0AAD4CL73_ASPNN|nr:hypothetical protein FE257_008502 [Aspergillus nanangensis]